MALFDLIPVIGHKLAHFDSALGHHLFPVFALLADQLMLACYAYPVAFKELNMLAAFRAISISEGLSYLTILAVTLGLISREFVYVIGMTHGVLFMLYLVASLLVSSQRGWSLVTWLGLLVAAIVPFAFVLVECFLRRAQAQNSSAEATG